jgi:hypothetical protein
LVQPINALPRPTRWCEFCQIGSALSVAVSQGGQGVGLRCSIPGRETGPGSAEEARRQARNSVQWRAQNAGGGGKERRHPDLLDDVISVDEVKIFKVSPRAYNLAPERMKVTNPELGFISANSWDINGGIRPLEILDEQLLTKREKLATLERWRQSILEELWATSEGMPTDGDSAELTCVLDEKRLLD